MNFAHHVPTEQQFTNHTLVNIIVLVAVVMVITGIFVAMSRRKNDAPDKSEEE